MDDPREQKQVECALGPIAGYLPQPEVDMHQVSTAVTCLLQGSGCGVEADWHVTARGELAGRHADVTAGL